METFDLIVIGSGPGGYVAAIHAAKRKLKVLCVEKDSTFGGTCLNVGCIPSKALLHSTEYFHRIVSSGKTHGIFFEGFHVDLETMMKRKEAVVASLCQGIVFLFKTYGVSSIRGVARFISKTTIEVEGKSYEAKNFILATGSEATSLPFLPFDEKRVLTSTGALALSSVPKKMLIIGAGIIGLELGSVYLRLGSEIEIVEILDRITPTFDDEVSKVIFHILKKQGMNFRLRCKVSRANVNQKGVDLFIEGEEKPVTGDVVLVSVGRRPYTSGLGIENLGIERDKQGRVVVDSCFRTSVPHIFAIGDLIDGPMLAHKAEAEGEAVVEFLTGGKKRIDYLAIPNVMYTWPEVAAVGMTEEEVKGLNLAYKVGKTTFKAIPRAKASGDEEGLVKILAEKETGRLLGMHIVGPQASEIIHEGMIAMEKRMSVKELGEMCHAHPTCAEAIKEAAKEF